ncbi:hypothetical protein KDN24_00655 [Bacillus sp. Bva_UNVM-123]|uniref:hypothetical protein n=1 Tax=Bacillus sp. Bva_UNVM-123 TaxID=2829798 RepID=UPI00391FA0B5
MAKIILVIILILLPLLTVVFFIFGKLSLAFSFGFFTLAIFGSVGTYYSMKSKDDLYINYNKKI